MVEPEDPAALAAGILDLYHHRDKAQHLARCGRQYALEQYSARRAIDRYEALFYALTSPQVWPGEGEVTLAVQK